jgi:hypothetical protein
MTYSELLWEIFSVVFVVSFVVIITLLYQKWLNRKEDS